MVITPGGVEIPVVGGGVEAVQDLLAVSGEEVAAHGLVSPAGGGVIVRNLPSVAEDTAAVSDWVWCRHVAPLGPVVTELPFTDTDRHLLVMEAVLVVTEVTFVAARTSKLLILVLQIPALSEESINN